jgi:hypothetical protein
VSSGSVVFQLCQIRRVLFFLDAGSTMEGSDKPTESRSDEGNVTTKSRGFSVLKLSHEVKEDDVSLDQIQQVRIFVFLLSNVVFYLYDTNKMDSKSCIQWYFHIFCAPSV